MGLFGKMFEKKNCDICGGEIGLLGNKKLEDGNLCKECASKLSLWFSDRRRSTVDQIREQLDWREANQQRVAQFNPTRTLGNDMKVILDEVMEYVIRSNNRDAQLALARGEPRRARFFTGHRLRYRDS